MCYSSCYRKIPTFGDLFEYLGRECNFHKRKSDGETTWKCDGDLSMTQQFCQDHNLNFVSVKEKLQSMGGFCDCEVLFNVVGHVNERKTLDGKINEKN